MSEALDSTRRTLEPVNSMTKYPSVPTYHTLGPNGVLLPETVPFRGPVIGTEMIDGVNARIIVPPNHRRLLVGSREHLLHAVGDLVYNPASSIVETLLPLVNRIPRNSTDLRVYFLEVFGGREITPASKQYSSTGHVAVRLFDVAVVPAPQFNLMLNWTAERIASWRKAGGQTFLVEDALTAAAVEIDVPLAPRLFTVDAAELPVTVPGMHALINEHLPRTRVALDDNAQARPEGIVLRTPDRSTIAKARLHSYRYTAKFLPVGQAAN